MITLKKAIEIANSVVPWCEVKKCWDLDDGWAFNHYDTELNEYPDLDLTFVSKKDGKATGFWIADYKEKWLNRVEVDISNLKG